MSDTDWEIAITRSKKRSKDALDALDLESAIPTTPSDVRALQTIRDESDRGGRIWLRRGGNADLFPVSQRRTTSEGWEPFSL